MRGSAHLLSRPSLVQSVAMTARLDAHAHIFEQHFESLREHEPFLRVANMFEDRIDARSLCEMPWPGDSFDRFRVITGDVLLNEGQTTELLGRPALYRGQPPMLRHQEPAALQGRRGRAARVRATGVSPAHARGPVHQGESRITTNIAHLSAARLKAIEFPIPPVRAQQEPVNRAEEQPPALRHFGTETAAARAQSAGLRGERSSLPRRLVG